MTHELTDHFLPDYHDCPDINREIENRLTVPVKRVAARPIMTNEQSELPYEVLTTTWRHYDAQGPLTREKFEADLEGAVDALAAAINERGRFLAYPINTRPATSLGVAYHDWVGVDYPFDIRFIIELRQDLQLDGHEGVLLGFQFHLSTLLGKDE